MLPSTTLPLQNEGATIWTFAGDKVIGRTGDKKDGQWMGRFNAFSLSEAKLLWHLDQSLGEPDVDVSSRVFQDPIKNQWYLGTGPLSRLDPETGKVAWSIPCDQIGFVNPSYTRLLSGDRMLVMGTKKCDEKSEYDALKEPVFSMVDTNTGKVLWRYGTKSYEYELGLGFWARVAKYSGKRYSKEKRIQIESMLTSPKPAGDELDAPDPDRMALAGERFEGVNLSDGTPVFKTKDKVGILRGAFGGRIFFREGDEVTAYDMYTGAEAWKFDLKKKNTTIYTVDDLIAEGHSVPEGIRDIFISEAEVVSRVSTETGKALWTIKREGMNWQGSKHGLLTKGGSKTIAYDWTTGAKLWESKIGGKPKGVDAGDYIVFADGTFVPSAFPDPPYELTIAVGKTGQIVWTKKEVNGKKIDELDLDVPGVIRLQSEKGVEFLNIADGKPATVATAAAGSKEPAGSTFIKINKKGVKCLDAAGKVVWERKGEPGLIPPDQPKNGMVFWSTEAGGVEVINVADGSTLWKAATAKLPEVVVNNAGTYMVVQNKKEVTIVKLKP